MILNSTVITDIKSFINTGRGKAIRAVDTERVLMYRHIGQRILLAGQGGKDRADYGKSLVEHISESLKSEFGFGILKKTNRISSSILSHLTFKKVKSSPSFNINSCRFQWPNQIM